MIVSFLLVIIALLAIGEFLLFGALAEAYRDIRQIHRHVGMADETVPVDLGAVLDNSPSELGLHPDLDSAAAATVVYVENRCETCRRIVKSLAGDIPSDVWLTVIADSAEEAFGWLGDAGITAEAPAAHRVMVAPAEEVERHLGALITPLALEIESGRPVRARSLGSVQQFYSMVPAAPTLTTAQKDSVK